MINSSKKLKLENNEKISLSKISRIGLLENLRKEIIKDNIIEKIEITDDEKEIIKKNWLKINSINNEKKLEKWKKENLQLDEDWEFFISRDFKWNKWCIDKFENQIEDYFQEKKPLLDLYIYSMIRVKSEGLSNEIYLRIKDNESDFYSIAREFSEGIEQKTGGLVGPSNLKNPHPIIANILKESENNQLWSPKKINDWWVIIRLEEKILATLDLELKIELSKELGEKYLQKEIKLLKKRITK